MKKIINLVLIVLMIFASVGNVYASEDLKVEHLKFEEKLKAHQDLIESGVIESIDKEILDYYEKNEKSIITSDDFSNLSFEEREALTNEIELSMLASTKAHGSNTMSWSAFENGDIVLVHDGSVFYGYFRHGGTYNEETDSCISAQMSNQGYGKGVIYEPKTWYNTQYDVAAGYATYNNNSTTRANVMAFLEDQVGEKYSLTSGYYTWDKWSCVKLPWVGWYEKANINIAVDVSTLKPLRKIDGICFPDSIDKSPDTFRFSYGS